MKTNIYKVTFKSWCAPHDGDPYTNGERLALNKCGEDIPFLLIEAESHAKADQKLNRTDVHSIVLVGVLHK